MDEAAFLAKYGPVYEDSPWVAEGVWPQAEHLTTVRELSAAMARVVNSAPHEKKLALIRAHPELAGRAKMAESSVKEQAGAGLDQCTPEEFEAFQRLNVEYNAKFGFPFIVAVKGMTRGDILAAFEARLGNDPDDEFAEAIRQIHRIARIRLDSMK